MTATEAEILEQFEVWSQALRSGDPERVAALYAEDAELVPTCSNRVRITPEEIRDYFVEFLRRRPRARMDESHVRVRGDIAWNAGLYSFFFGEEETPTQARFCFVYRRAGDRWLILTHHSSMLYCPPDAPG